MLEQARKRFGLDYGRCVLVGDTTCDIQTGANAGCQTILVKTGYGGHDGRYDVAPDLLADDLGEAVRLVLRRYRSE